MTHIEAMKQGLEALEVEDMACRYEKEATPEHIAKAITSLRQSIADAEKENALQSLHAENERLGLYKDAYAEQEPDKYAIDIECTKCGAQQSGILTVHTTPPQHTEQKPVIDKSAAIRIATALGWEPKREWVGLTDEDWVEIFGNSRTIGAAVRNTEAKLKEKNA